MTILYYLFTVYSLFPSSSVRYTIVGVLLQIYSKFYCFVFMCVGRVFFFYMFFTCISYIKCMVHKYMCTRACVRECVCMYCTPTRQGRQCESETTSKSLESFAIRIACHYRAHLNIHISISLPHSCSLSLSLCVCVFPPLLWDVQWVCV